MAMKRQDLLRSGSGVAAALAVDALTVAKPRPPKHPTRQREADVVVIGSGATGLPAASVARQAGALVILPKAEKDINADTLHGLAAKIKMQCRRIPMPPDNLKQTVPSPAAMQLPRTSAAPPRDDKPQRVARANHVSEPHGRDASGDAVELLLALGTRAQALQFPLPPAREIGLPKARRTLRRKHTRHLG